MASDKTTTTTTEPTFAQAITLLARELRQQDPLERAGLSQERIDVVKKLPAPKRWRRIPWRSPETGATAIAHVVESRTWPKTGRIIELREYRHPREAYVLQAEGGHVPDGFPMWDQDRAVDLPLDREPAPGVFTPKFLTWRWQNYWQRDLRRFVGAEVSAAMCQDHGGMDTPWQEGRVGAIEA